MESTISLVDAVADNHETESEVANALAGATLTNIGVSTAEEDAEWLEFLAKSEGTATPTPMVVPPYMPQEVQLKQETVGERKECPQKQKPVEVPNAEAEAEAEAEVLKMQEKLNSQLAIL